MKHLFPFLLLFCMTAVNAQTILKGDMNDDKDLNIADVTSLVDVVLGKAPKEEISVGGDPYKVDNSLVVGTWVAPDHSSFALNEDGTTTYPDAATYKFRPVQGVLTFYDASENPIRAIVLNEVTADYLMAVDYATNTFTKYTKQTAFAELLISGETSFEESTVITIIPLNIDHDVYYTLDGTDPKTSITRKCYMEPFSITETCTVKAWEENVDIYAEKTFTKAEPETPAEMTVEEVIAAAPESTNAADGQQKVWVTGYIVGYVDGQAYATGAHFDADGCEVKTNLLIATSNAETNVENCIPVQLPSGDIRAALNLQDNPENLGKEVKLYGYVLKYFNVAGLKNVTDYILADNPQQTTEMTVEEVIAAAPESTNAADGQQKVWVTGYIVGYVEGESFATGAHFDADGCEVKTNLLIATSNAETNVENCIPVQLPSGDIRAALNLQDNPDNLGKEVKLYGYVLKYFSVAGLKNVTDYLFIDNPQQHSYVDLGLPSGTLWAACNIGADNPEDYGDYFAWGETEGYNSGKKTFNWSTYKWQGSSLIKYNAIDNKKELELEDDVAYVSWGPSWRMPSIEQFQELINSNYTVTEWTKQNDVYGIKITSKKNGIFIFLPATGYYSETWLYYAGSYGYYWSRTLYTENPDLAIGLFFEPEGATANGYDGRSAGRTVRPVRLP